MVTMPRRQRGRADSWRVERATFRPGEFGRLTRPDGTSQWWVRSSSGAWMALSHQRVIENDDGTITLLYLN
jgi:hypothetical protein